MTLSRRRLPRTLILIFLYSCRAHPRGAQALLVPPLACTRGMPTGEKALLRRDSKTFLQPDATRSLRMSLAIFRPGADFTSVRSRTSGMPYPKQRTTYRSNLFDQRTYNQVVFQRNKCTSFWTDLSFRSIYRLFAFLARRISFCFAKSSFIFSIFFMPFGGMFVTSPVIVFFHTGRPVTCECKCSVKGLRAWTSVCRNTLVESLLFRMTTDG